MKDFLKNPINQLGISVVNLFLAYLNVSLGHPITGILVAMCAGWGLRQAAISLESKEINK